MRSFPDAFGQLFEESIMFLPVLKLTPSLVDLGFKSEVLIDL